MTAELQELLHSTDLGTIKKRIDAIEEEFGRLQDERFLLGLRHSLLLKQNALAHPQVEPQKQFSTWADAKHAPGRTGFELDEFEERT